MPLLRQANALTPVFRKSQGTKPEQTRRPLGPANNLAGSNATLSPTWILLHKPLIGDIRLVVSIVRKLNLKRILSLKQEPHSEAVLFSIRVRVAHRNSQHG